MAQIPFIEDAYIDDVIKSAGAYDPTLNLTQGVKLRELLKLMRDSLAQGGSGSVGLAAIPVTYAELVSMINGSTLVAGQKYLLTDFQSTFIYSGYYTDNNNRAGFYLTDLVYSGDIEPIILTAVASGKLSSIAKSVLFPGDEIVYTYQNKNGGILSSTKGTILSREDKVMLAYANFDWRVAKYKYIDDETGLEVIKNAVTFKTNQWGISNSKVFAFNSYGTIGPILIGSIIDSEVRSDAYIQVALGNVSGTTFKECEIVNRLCDLSNCTFINSATYNIHKPLSIRGVDAAIGIDAGHIPEDVFESLQYTNESEYNDVKILAGPSNQYTVKYYKQFIDIDGVFQTVAIT